MGPVDMTKVFVCYSLDWTGPQVHGAHATRDEGEVVAEKGSPYLFLAEEEFPEQAKNMTEVLEFFQELYWRRFTVCEPCTENVLNFSV